MRVVPRPGIVVTETETRADPVLTPLLEQWRSSDDSAYRRFAATDDES
jgi:hypothetical protein